MINFDLEDSIYDPQPGDTIIMLDSPRLLELTPVNLNAISYYAKLGMKPRGIAPLVGCSHTTIYNRPELYAAYEKGKAYHELVVRSALIRNINDNAAVLLARAVGPAEIDYNEGMAPEERADNTIKIKYEIADSSSDPEIEALKTLLNDRIAEADDRDNQK